MKQLILILLFLFSGCASNYQLSKELIEYRSSLNEQTALEIVKQNIVKNSEQQGICSATTHTVVPVQTRQPAVEGANLLFTSDYSVAKGMVTTSTGVGMMKTTTLTETREGRYKVDLKNLNKIRVMNDPKPWGCPRPLAGHIVMIDEPGLASMKIPEDKNQLIKPTNVRINVSKRNLEHFLAALSYLSPEAKILQGE